MDDYHVVKDGGVWQLRREGSASPVERAQTKEEILHKTQEYMRGRVGSVKIHTEHGQIEEERTYPRSEDPRRSEG